MGKTSKESLIAIHSNSLHCEALGYSTKFQLDPLKSIEKASCKIFPEEHWLLGKLNKIPQNLLWV